jgi:hypothetical protein
MAKEELAVSFNRAVQRHFGVGAPVSTLEIKIACGALLTAYLGAIPDVRARRESFEEFVFHMWDELKLGGSPTEH